MEKIKIKNQHDLGLINQAGFFSFTDHDMNIDKHLTILSSKSRTENYKI